MEQKELDNRPKRNKEKSSSSSDKREDNSDNSRSDRAESGTGRSKQSDSKSREEPEEGEEKSARLREDDGSDSSVPPWKRFKPDIDSDDEFDEQPHSTHLCQQYHQVLATMDHHSMKEFKVLINMRRKGPMSAAMRKKLLDREIPWSQIPDEQKPQFAEARDKEWDAWLRNRSVRVMTIEESEETEKNEDPARILRSDFKFKEKNNAFRSEENPLSLKAKERLCGAGQDEPDAQEGLLKLDAPTVQRVGFFCFLQVVVQKRWLAWFYLGDISEAFLQGTRRNTGKRLFLRQPKGGLPGLDPRQLLEVLKGIFGLPDAPRGWFVELAGFLVGTLGFVAHRLDAAFFLLWEAGKLICIIIIHCINPPFSS